MQKRFRSLTIDTTAVMSVTRKLDSRTRVKLFDCFISSRVRNSYTNGTTTRHIHLNWNCFKRNTKHEWNEHYIPSCA